VSEHRPPENRDFPLPACVEKNGYCVRFLEPEKIKTLIEEFFEKTFKNHRPNWRSCIKAFSQTFLDREFGNDADIKAFEKLRDGEFVYCWLGTAFHAKYPVSHYELHFEGTHYVEIIPSGKLQAQYAVYYGIEGKAFKAAAARKHFFRKLGDDFTKDDEVLNKFLKGGKVEARNAGRFLTYFPYVEFRRIHAGRGRPSRTAQVITQMRKRGARLGFIPMGAADPYINVLLKSVLKSAGIESVSFEPVAPSSLAHTSKNYDFIINCHPLMCEPHPARMILKLFEPEFQFFELRKLKARSSSDLGKKDFVAAISGSAEHVLARNLGMTNLALLNNPNPLNQYVQLVEYLLNGDVATAAFSTYAISGHVQRIISRFLPATSALDWDRIDVTTFPEPAQAPNLFLHKLIEGNLLKTSLRRATQKVVFSPKKLEGHNGNAFFMDIGLVSCDMHSDFSFLTSRLNEERFRRSLVERLLNSLSPQIDLKRINPSILHMYTKSLELWRM
jgi:hypothetical protein